MIAVSLGVVLRAVLSLCGEWWFRPSRCHAGTPALPGETMARSTAAPSLTAPMSQSPSAHSIQAPVRRRQAARSRWSWRRAIGLGLCFGLGYGLTMRLLDLPIATSWKGVQRFAVKTFPGSELDSLRRQYGDRQGQIRGDLDLLELERQQKRNAAELGKRQAEMEAREQQESQALQGENDRQRLEALPQDQQEFLPPPAAELAPVQETVPPAPAPLTPPSLPPAPRPSPATPSAPAAQAPATNPPTTP